MGQKPELQLCYVLIEGNYENIDLEKKEQNLSNAALAVWLMSAYMYTNNHTVLLGGGNHVSSSSFPSRHHKLNCAHFFTLWSVIGTSATFLLLEMPSRSSNFKIKIISKLFLESSVFSFRPDNYPFSKEAKWAVIHHVCLNDSHCVCVCVRTQIPSIQSFENMFTPVWLYQHHIPPYPPHFSEQIMSIGADWNDFEFSKAC